jgi:hypothetical protein
MRPSLLCVLLLTIVTSALRAGEPPQSCPCVPITHLWTVKTCADWNCASAEIAVANGDPQVIVIPVGMNDGRWLIIRRLVAGAAIDSGDTFLLEQYNGMTDAVRRFSAFGTDYKPMLMSAPDGQVLVIGLRQPERRRVAAH